MGTIAFDRLLLKTAFCCMASDGDIDNKEVEQIKLMCEKSSLFANLDFQEAINVFISELNKEGKLFINRYFDELKTTSWTEEEEISLIDFAIQTIMADNKIEYSEIKFFKIIRHNLKISDEKILAVYPDIEYWLEKDIVTESYLDKIKQQYLDIMELPEFQLIKSV
jgi:uncharacterized tellurite resistance protein B-like protein